MDIANLVIRVTNEGLTAAQRELRRLRDEANGAESRANKLSDSMKRMAKYGAAAMGALGVAVGALAVDYADTAREISNLANIAGSSTDELQRMAAASQTVGIDMEKLGDISKDTREKIGDFLNTGGGGMQDFADAMGYTEQQANSFAESMKGLSGIEILQEMVNRMEAGGVSAVQMSHALEGMGSDATALIPILQNGGAEAQRLAEQFDATGAAMSALEIENALQLSEDLSVLKDTMTGVKNEVLAGLMPSLIAIAQTLAEKIPVAVDFVKSLDFSPLVAVWGNLKSVISATGDVIAPVIDFFKEHDKLSEALAISIGLVAGAFVTYNAAVAIGTAVTGGFVAALALLTSPVTLTIAALTALTAAGVYVYQNWDEIKAKAASIWGSITSYIGGKIDAIKSYFSTNFPAMTAIVSGSIEIIKTLVVGGFELISNAIKTTLAVIKAVISGDFKAIPGIIGNGLKGAVSIVSSMMTNILNVIKEAGKKLFNIGRDFIQGFINGIKSIGSGVVSAASSMVGSAIAAVKRKQDSASPSKVTTKLGGDFSQGMAVGIKKGAKKVVTEAQRMAEQAIKAVEDGIAGLQKRIALFGDNTELSSLMYDIGIGRFKGASQSRVDEYVRQQKALSALESQLKATNAVQARFDKWQDERDKMRSNATDLIKGRFAQFGKDKASSSNNLQGMLSGLEQESPLGKIQADYEARNAIIEKYEQTHTDMVNVANEARLASDKAYMDAKRDLLLGQGEAIFGNLAGLSKAFLGEQSGVYKALFAIEKGYTLATVLLKNKEAIAKAWASAPFPANLGAVASTVAGTAGLASAISGIMPKGFKQGGYTGNMGASQVAGVVHGQEYVFDAQSTKRIGVDNLNAMRRGDSPKGSGGDVNISVTVTGDKATVSGDNERMGRDMANGIKAVVMDVMRKEKRQGGMLYGA